VQNIFQDLVKYLQQKETCSMILFFSELHKQEVAQRQQNALQQMQPLKKPRQRKRKKLEGEAKEPGKKRKKAAAVAGQLGVTGPVPSGLPPPTLPPPMPKQDDIDFTAITEQIMQTLRTLPILTLQEPLVDIFHSICPVVGMGSHPLTG
jgi:hypothetical protein